MAPAIGGYIFDDREVVLGAYWEHNPPPEKAPSLLLSGGATQPFFRAYWSEIWRRGVWLNENGAENLAAVREIAERLKLAPAEWPRFVDEARNLRFADGGPPLF